ncbi:MAG: cytochrome b subunit of the bc complex [Anaerolineae bacterium]
MSKPSVRKHIPFFPDLFVAELMVTALVLTVLFLATALGYDAPLEDQADPFLTPAHAQAPWYFLFLQGLLKITPKLVGGFLVPALIVGGLLALPYLDRGPATARRGKLALALVIVTGLAWAALTFIGTPAFGID